MQKGTIGFLVLTLAVVTMIFSGAFATIFGVYAVPADSNVVDVQYGATMQIGLVSQQIVLGADPNTVEVRTVLRVMDR